MNMKETILFADAGQTARGSERRTEDAHRLIGELLLRMGIGPHLVGFDPLCEGIRILAEQDREAGFSPADVFPLIEELCGVTNGEHAVRDAICAGFLHPEEIHSQIFPFSNRPSNCEFICTLAELVRNRIRSRT